MTHDIHLILNGFCASCSIGLDSATSNRLNSSWDIFHWVAWSLELATISILTCEMTESECIVLIKIFFLPYDKICYKGLYLLTRFTLALKSKHTWVYQLDCTAWTSNLELYDEVYAVKETVLINHKLTAVTCLTNERSGGLSQNWLRISFVIRFLKVAQG